MTDEIPGKKKIKTAQDAFRAEFKRTKVPDDFDDEDAFIDFTVKLYEEDASHDQVNRQQGQDDSLFLAGEQWDSEVLQSREKDKKPSLIFNRLLAFVAQILGNRRLNETAIKITADDNKFKPAAKIREGLIRSIQKISRADLAFNKALETQVTSGIGNFELCLEYAHDDVFEQDIRINAINDAFAVIWDRNMCDQSGKDADHVFVTSVMPRAEFKEQWPDGIIADFPIRSNEIKGVPDGWVREDDVRVVNFWRMRTRKRIVALVRDEDGTEDVQDITDVDFKDVADSIVTTTEGVPVMREVDRKFAQLYIMTAKDVLEGPYELPISRVPVFRVPGWEITTGETTLRFGLIRFLKDPQRLHNFWRSIIAEKLMGSPKATWLAADEAVEGHEQAYRDSHLSNNSLLLFNAESGVAPIRIPPTQIEGGLLEQSNATAQDIRDISNMHEASLGQQSNEVSGKALIARQRIGEIGTVIYLDNLDIAIEECGITINELIPFVYDTIRTIKILGEEGDELSPVIINDETNSESVDITAGKYSVTSSTGPNFVTKRVEAQESMLSMVNSVPGAFEFVMDKIVEAQDWPGSDEIVRRMRTQLPPGIVSVEDMSPEQQQQVADAQEQAGRTAQLQEALGIAELEEKQARAAQAKGLAMQAQANAAEALARIEITELEAVVSAEQGRIKLVLEAARLFEDLTEGETDGR